MKVPKIGLPMRVVREGVLEVTVPERSARVQIREHRTETEHALVLTAPICASHRVEAGAVLALVAQMGAGAIALIDDEYVVRFTVPVAMIAPAPIETAIRYVADVASSLGAVLAPIMATDLTSFDHYAD